jgi:hypothetical protein
LKGDLHLKDLVISGSRFDLIHRLAQHEASDTTGVEAKKAAGTFDETGKF